MSLNTFIKAGIAALLGGPIILVEKATAIFKEKFTFTAFEIAKIYQESYNYALAAITAGLAEPEREFAAQIEQDYLQPFAALKGLSIPELRLQLIEQLQQLVQQPPIFTAENRRFTESELVSFIKDDGALAITDLILAQCTLDKTLEAFLRYDDLLGKATLFFFRELLHDDARAKTTLETLQRENLLVKVDDTQDQVLPQRLQSAVASWQNRHQQFLEFYHRFSIWAQLLDVQTLLEEFRAFMQRFDLSTEVKPRDEFTHHTPASLAQIQETLAKLKRLPVRAQTSEVSKTSEVFWGQNFSGGVYQLSLLAGSVVSSTGEIAEAEKLFIQARDCAQNKADKALASFNLFQVRLRHQAYPDAFADLQSAIANDPSYALHNISRYPMEKLLGAGSMGCVFLCHDVDENNKLVAVKCFWEGHKGARQQVFKEAILMRDIASDYVPKLLHWDYADAIRDEKPYFVTEYISGALDGEAWIEKYGKLDILTGLDVGIHIAKALQLAHEHKIYHLNLKPANLLLKQTKTGISVKIIDFGLAQAASSLRDCVLQRSATGKTQFGQMIIGTLYYAPPEQLEHGEPSAKSDLYAFGASLYRLMTGEIYQPSNPECLTEAPPALFQLLCQCLNRIPEQRPDSAQQLVNRLEEIKVGLRKPVVEIPPVQAEVAQQQSNQPKSFFSIFKEAFGGLVVIVAATLIWFNSENNGPNAPKETAASSLDFRDRLKDGSLGPKMVWIPAGRFRMGDIQGDGDDDEKPVHEVSVARFAMSQYEVRVGEFWQFVNATGYKTEAEKGDGCYSYKGGWKKLKEANWLNSYLSQNENHPVVCVSWNDANAYAKWLSEETGQKYRLPTEAEWEYAARAGTETKYWWGNEIGFNKANCWKDFCGDSFEYTAPVGSFTPNPFGLYDTVGNVWEWTCSEYEDKYEGNENSHKENASLGVIRSGSWYNEPRYVRVMNRNRTLDINRYVNVGFRLARL
jgi:formylglycine-generating enzyme required for sulfatase activity/tetratricopeptide (TPR) repeat protein